MDYSVTSVLRIFRCLRSLAMFGPEAVVREIEDVVPWDLHSRVSRSLDSSRVPSTGFKMEKTSSETHCMPLFPFFGAPHLPAWFELVRGEQVPQ